MDPILTSEDDDDDINQHDIKIEQKRYENIGYVEGIEIGKSLELQNGFDKGFCSGSILGHGVHIFRGAISTLLAIEGSKKICNEKHKERLVQILKQFDEKSFHLITEEKKNELIDPLISDFFQILQDMNRRDLIDVLKPLI